MSENHEDGLDVIELERTTLDDLRNRKDKVAQFLLYRWQYHSELARQRNEIQDRIKDALIQSCTYNYKFRQMQRAVKYRYGLHPLSTLGSLQYIGGRFNVGMHVNSEIASFPGLYIAKDKNTALQEHLGQVIPPDSKLTPHDLALTNPSSETIVSISGQLDSVFDLTEVNNLTGFVNLINQFTLSEELALLAKKINILKIEIIKTPQLLLNNLLDPSWRTLPSCYDVPSNSQIFGHLIYQAGIEGIVYPSKFTNELCLTIFPHNFPGKDSFLIIDDDVPHKNVPKRIDSNNWHVCDLTFNEICK